MRILFLDQYSDSGGAQLCLADVLAGVADRGWDAELWAPCTGFLHARARACGFDAYDLPLGLYTNGSKSLRDVARYARDLMRCRGVLARAIRRCKPDVVYVNGPRLLPFIAGLRLPVIFHSHSVLDQGYSRWIARGVLCRGSTQVLASSEFLADPLRRLAATDRVQVIYNGVPDCRIPRETVGPVVRVGLVGRIAPEKGHLDFLEAARLLAHHRDLQFVIVGQAMFSQGTYEAQVRETGVALGVEFMGWQDPHELYRGLDILVVPSAAHDANPRVIAEAMSAGTCVIAYRSGGIAEMIRDGHDGLLTARTPVALADAVRAMATDEALRARIQANARARYEQQFTVPRFQREVCEAIALAARLPELRPTVSRSARQAIEPADDKQPVSR